MNEELNSRVISCCIDHLVELTLPFADMVRRRVTEIFREDAIQLATPFQRRFGEFLRDVHLL